jgi:stress-induced morphogen
MLTRRIGDKLRARFGESARIAVVDESHQHRGHAAMKGLNPSETHFHVSVVSDVLASLSKLERHRLVHALLADELRDGVHALRLDLRSAIEASPSS